MTFTTVRHMSKMRSMGKIRAIHAGLSPTLSSTMIIKTKPALGMAAAPTEARVAVSTMTACCARLKSTMWNCARATTATAWYRLVPSMFTVAPMGRTKLVVRSLTPMFSCTHFMVTGKVATEDEVENAVIWASRMAAKNRRGVMPRMPALASKGYTTKIISTNPSTTTKPYRNKKLSSSWNFSGSVPAALTICPAMRANTNTGMAFITIHTMPTNTSFNPSTAFNSAPRLGSSTCTRTMPKNTAKKMICSIAMSLSARKMFLGTTSTRGCKGPLWEALSALFSLSSTHAFKPSCWPRMSRTTAAFSGAAESWRSSNTSMPLASRQSS